MNVLLFGLGAIGLGYDLNFKGGCRTHARAIANITPERFIAIDPIEERRKIFESIYGYESRSSSSELPFDFHPELVVISSPTQQHLPDLKTSISLEPKIIVIEKPLAAGIKELDKMLKIEASFSGLLVVNLIRNFMSGIQEFMARIPNENLDIVVQYSKGLVHNGVHFMSLILQKFGSNIELVSSHQVSSEQALARFRFQNGFITFVPNSSEANNSMIINASNSECALLAGGRYLYDSRNSIPLVECKGFDHYQEQVLGEILKSQQRGGLGDSFTTAIQAQKILEQCFQEN